MVSWQREAGRARVRDLSARPRVGFRAPGACSPMEEEGR